MSTANEIIKKAVSYIGTKESPANSNNVIFNTHYYGKSVSGSAYPWCCAFVWDIFRICGASSLFCGGSKTAYCPTVENYYKGKGRFYSSGEPGDLVLMDFGKGRASHIGICEKKNADGTYSVIEGNTSTSSNDNGGSVMRRTRKKSVIRGFGRPNYEVQTTTSSTVVQAQPVTWVSTGLKHSKTFTGVTDTDVSKAKARVLQHAMNLDYGKSISEDGIFGTKSKAKLGSHYVEKGEKQYMCSALEILLYLNNLNPNGVEYPGTYGNGVVTAAKAKFGGTGTKVTATQFLSLL